MQHQDTVNLQSFVDASKEKGAADEFLAALLIRRGWPADDVYAALADYWERATGLAVPRRAGSGESARDAFLYLLAFSTLATWIIALGSMLFEFADYWLPDLASVGNTPDLRTSVTWQMASVAVAFPVFLVVMRAIFRETASNPERLQSGVRKWLTWTALLGTAATAIGDLICFLAFFLMGEFTLRFALKSGTVGVLCAAVFAYYLGSLRWTRETSVARERKRGIVFGAASVAVVAAVFCVGLGVAGTPAVQRRIEADRTRIKDLRVIAILLRQEHKKSGKVPETLAGLRGGRLRDPETWAPYEYHAKGADAWELCATFATNGTGGNDIFWDHRAGRGCFTFEASKDKDIPW